MPESDHAREQELDDHRHVWAEEQGRRAHYNTRLRLSNEEEQRRVAKADKLLVKLILSEFLKAYRFKTHLTTK